MAVGQISKIAPFYVSWETANDACLKGSLITQCTSASGVKLVAGTAADGPPYGVCISSQPAVGSTVAVCWLGVVEVKANTAAGVIYACQPLASTQSGTLNNAWTTALPEGRIVGFAVEAQTQNASLLKIRLGAW